MRCIGFELQRALVIIIVVIDGRGVVVVVIGGSIGCCLNQGLCYWWGWDARNLGLLGPPDA